MNPVWRPTRRELLIAGAAALPGCGVVPAVNEPVLMYDLVTPIAFEGSFPSLEDQLTVAIPVASADLDSTRIALSRNAGVIEYFAKGAWTDNAPILIQNRLIEAFEINGAIRAVGRDAAGLQPDLVLQTELRDFQAEFAGASTMPSGAPIGMPTGHIRLAAKLIGMPARRIVHFQVVERTEPADGPTLPEIVRALDKAAAGAVREIVLGVLSVLV